MLILSGTADSLTPWLNGATMVASQFGKSARVVRVANLTHVTLQVPTTPVLRKFFKPS